MLLLKIQTFLKSLLFHICKGFPKTNNSEILYRYNICLVCDNFNSIKYEFTIWGCAISKQSKFLNKLAWADQECPLNKWPKIER